MESLKKELGDQIRKDFEVALSGDHSKLVILAVAESYFYIFIHIQPKKEIFIFKQGLIVLDYNLNGTVVVFI